VASCLHCSIDAPFSREFEGYSCTRVQNNHNKHTAMVTISLDNIQSYTPDPPPSRPCGASQSIISTDMPTSNHVICTLPTAVPALSKTFTQTETPEHLECSFVSAEIRESPCWEITIVLRALGYSNLWNKVVSRRELNEAAEHGEPKKRRLNLCGGAAGVPRSICKPWRR
jgi:hypothetical protein